MQIHWRLRPFALISVSAVAVSLLGLASGFASAQISTARVEGLRENNPRWHAIIGARIVTAPGKVIENGTIVMRDGVIVSVGAKTTAPAGAKVWNL
jgi:hypothetical protein